MGRTQAQAMNDEPIDLRTKLLWHLRVNHYPPVHPLFVDTALDAIEWVNAGQWDRRITMPNRKVKTAGEIIAGLHLEDFLD